MTHYFNEGVKEILASLALATSPTVASTQTQHPTLIKPAEMSLADIESKYKSDKQGLRPLSTEEATLLRELTKGGLTTTAAIGVIANLRVESNLNPAARQLRNGPGRGLAQWEKGGRFDTDRINLVKFAKKKEKPWTDFETQIEFIVHELDKHPEYMKVKQELNKAKTVKDATMIFLKKYEKAGIAHADRRLAYAKELKDKLKLDIK
jgi:hypothetical protein